MSNKTMYPVKSPQRDRVPVHVSFQCNGSGAPTALKGNVNLYSVAKTNTGHYTITFTDAYNDLESAQATLRVAATEGVANFYSVQLGDWNSTAKTLVVRLWLGNNGAAIGAELANLAANTNNRISVACVFRNTLQNA